MVKSLKKIQAVGYSVFIGNDAIMAMDQFIAKNKYPLQNIFVLADENTSTYCLPLLMKESKTLPKATIIKIESGEQHKNIKTCIQIWTKLTNAQADRKSLFINLGGGVITDMGGFAASTFKRGIDFINVPTTLLSQVDASVGGKLGIDFGHFKNHIGLFVQPKAIFISSKFLATLPKRQINSGFAEVIKHLLLFDQTSWKSLKKTHPEKIKNWDDVILKAVSLKNKIVTEDPFEKNIRKSLNFGHTVGHAIESYFMKKKNFLLHGEAIAVGMICEAFLSWQLGELSKSSLDEISTFIFSIFEKINIPKTVDKVLVERMHHDKKNEKGAINFSLIRGIGKVKIDQEIGEKLIFQSIEYYRKIRVARTS